MKRLLALLLLISSPLAVISCDQPNKETSTAKPPTRGRKTIGSQTHIDDAKPIREPLQDLIEEENQPTDFTPGVLGEEVAFVPDEDEDFTLDHQDFHEALSPHGTWFDSDQYGSVWQPALSQDSDWRPYSQGQWSYSEQGWTWVSTEPFGWVTYHYGRWARLQNWGWIWVPGNVWAPNWCTWRSNDSYIGWAPLPPETLAYPFNEWDAGVERRYGITASCFTFINTTHFDRPIFSHCLPVRQNTSCFRVTTNITRIRFTDGRIYCGGPRFRELSERLGRQLPVRRIVRSRPNPSRQKPRNLQNRIKDDQLIVVAPKIRSTRPVKIQRRLVGFKTERSSKADPNAINAYRQIRQKETNPITTGSVARIPTKPSPRPNTSRPLNRNNTPQNDPDIKPTTLTTDPQREDKQRAINAQIEQRERNARQHQQAEIERQQQEEVMRKQRAEQQRQQAAEQLRQRAEEQRQQEAEQRKQREDMLRRQREDAERKQREEQRRRQAEEQRRQREAMLQRQREEAQRRQREEQQRRQAEDQRRQAEEQRRQREEAARRQREDAQRRQREDAQRRQREDAQRKQREDAQRRKREQNPPRKRGK